MQFFVNTKKTVRLYPWGEGDNAKWWIQVKECLSAKEAKDVQAAGIPHLMQKPGDPDEREEDKKQREVKMGLDMGRMSIVRASKYIVQWSLVDADGDPMPLSEAAIGELLEDKFDAIDKALDAHAKAQEAAKNAVPLAGATGQKSA